MATENPGYDYNSAESNNKFRDLNFPAIQVLSFETNKKWKSLELLHTSSKSPRKNSNWSKRKGENAAKKYVMNIWHAQKEVFSLLVFEIKKCHTCLRKIEPTEYNTQIGISHHKHTHTHTKISEKKKKPKIRNSF